MGRWLGIDHGTRRIGVAVGSTSDGVATPLTVIEAASVRRAAERIRRLADDYGAEGIVVGLPLNMNGTEGPQAKLARAAAADLAEATGMDVRLWDERLSSFTADELLAGTLSRKKARRRQDAVSAAAILRDFLASDGPRAAPPPGQTRKDGI